MQATVRSFDPADGSGTLLADDGTRLEFGAAAFAASGLRLLRPGQRVSIRLGDGGAVTALALATFPLPGD
jgi:cold shock CspA family protein